MQTKLPDLAKKLSGELHWDAAMRTVYATDASAYREMPLAVAMPKTNADIQQLIFFANENRITLIPRAAGTSLAGQVVGSGLVVDISKHMTNILEVNARERWVRVQPGVIRDDLNLFLREHGLFFGPETSTANRAMIGGMVGNNSCGLHSVVWGSVRDHLLAVKGFLSDGSEVEFKELTAEELKQKQYDPLDFGAADFIEQVPANQKLEHHIYHTLNKLLSDPENQRQIRENFPKPSVKRRNTGYALDAMIQSPFGGGEGLCKLIAGSEGTLMFLTEITLNLLSLPPQEIGMVCVHTRTIDEALRANLIAMRHQPMASELVDKYILDFTKNHPEYDKNRFFIQGDPKAILMVEFMADTLEVATARTQALIADLRQAGLGYEFPTVFGAQTKQVWDVRKAGLGLIRNLPGDAQPVNLIEDCAVTVEDLPDYIAELEVLLTNKGLSYSMYAHAGAGELHVEPMINLKTSEGKVLFREVLAETAALVKKYGGSLSGEHGDGRLRGEFISFMMGEKVYQLFKDIKHVFDPNGIFNAGKITGTPPMDTHLRYKPGQQTPSFETVFDFSRQGGILRHAEQCSGSGDCRKTHLSGGTMCPSYMATREEKDTTRARANILREILTHSDKENRFDHPEIKEVMDLCLLCKSCKAECPSNVDVAKLKMEFLQHWHRAHGVPLRSRLIANFNSISALASHVPWAYNAVFGTPALRRLANRAVGFHPDRTMPPLAKTTLRRWHLKRANAPAPGRLVYLFCDEFTNHNDVEIGQKAILLLERLGYQVVIPGHGESGRAALSKGMLDKAKKIAEQNVTLLSEIISEETPLVGIEPSAILAFRDEYPELVGQGLRAAAHKLAGNALMLDEFLGREMDKGNISRTQFTGQRRLVKLHGHCQQKAVGSLVPTKRMLSLPQNYRVELIPSGCCGMAGSFGYEKEHYAVSMQIGGLVLFPAVRALESETLIAAPGTSCRHQIHDGTGRRALHPAEILYDALL